MTKQLYRHVTYDSDLFEATPENIAAEFVKLSAWLAQFRHDTVFFRLPPGLATTKDFYGDKIIGRVAARLSILLKAEDDNADAEVK
jgi:hypothetical protein